jgi:hypothetical protein
MRTLIESIKYNNGTFPRNELEQIIEHEEKSIPYLLQIMNELKKDSMKLIDRPTRIDFIYAYYLLAQFQVKELFPIMIDVLSQPSDICENIFGDTITEDIGRILASIFDGDIELLMSLIENTEANEYARGQALISLVVLVFNGQLSREFVMDYFKQLLTDKLTDTSYYFNTQIVCCCNDLYPEEVYADIGRLYEEELVEEIIIGMDSIDKTLKRRKEEVLQSNQQAYQFQFITDTIKELQGWACFHQDQFKTSAQSFSKRSAAAYDEPKRNPAVKVEKIGRNDPCTCGSGQKYKKCCGR